MQRLGLFPSLACIIVLIGGTFVPVINTPTNLPTTSANSGTTTGEWSSQPPADCPFHTSKDFGGIAFTGRHREYGNADTWYPSWALDDALYSPWTDGYIDGTKNYQPFSEKY